MLVEAPASPLPQLTKMLDKINEPRIVFKYGIRMLDARQHIAYIIKNRFGYTVCVEVEKDKVMRPLSQLTDTDINSIIQRLKLDYGGKVKGIK